MGLNHLEKYFTEKAAPYIAEAGGKIGGLNYLKDRVPELRHSILPVQVIAPKEKLGEIKIPAGDGNRFIVRGSHWMDFQGLVDVLPTKVGSDNIDWLVQDVQSYAQLPYVMDYAQYENSTYDGKIFVGIQPYLDCQRGSIVEHPNMPNHFVLSFIPQQYQTGSDVAITGIYNALGNDYENITGFYMGIVGGYDVRPRQIAELYRMIDSAGLVIPGYSLQMEFLNALEQVFVSQVRVFKKKEQAAFELEVRKRLVFGITPPEGIILPVFLSPDGFAYGECPNPGSPWAYLKPGEPGQRSRRDIHQPKSDEEKEADSLRFKPENLAAYLVGQSFGTQVNTSLEHHHFRMAQKADLTIFEGLINKGDFTRLFYTDSNCSDAREAQDKLRKMLIGMALSCGGSESDFITSLFQGRVMYNARIISDGRTATVEPILKGKSRNGRPMR